MCVWPEVKRGSACFLIGLFPFLMWGDSSTQRFVRRPSAFQIAGLPVRLQTSGRA